MRKKHKSLKFEILSSFRAVCRKGAKSEVFEKSQAFLCIFRLFIPLRPTPASKLPGLIIFTQLGRINEIMDI